MLLACALATLAAGPALAAAPGDDAGSALAAAPEDSGAEADEAAEPDLKADIRFKPGKGVRFRSADRRYSLRIRLRLQFLYTLEATGRPDALEVGHGFEVRRARVSFSGNIFGRHNEYKLVLALSPTGIDLGDDGTVGKSPVLSASVTLSHLRDLTVRIGQFTVKYNRQRSVPSSRLQFVDRGLVSRAFDFGYDRGLQLGSNDVGGVDRLQWAAGVFMGEGRGPMVPSDGGLLYVVRVATMPGGIYGDYGAQGDLDLHRRFRLGLGGAYAFHHRARSGPDDDPDVEDSHHATADLHLVGAGFSLDTACFWRNTRPNVGWLRNHGDTVLVDADGRILGLDEPVDDLGWYAQAGQVMPVPVEVAVRYGQVRRAFRDPDAQRLASELGGALSWYIHGHPYKLQADYFRLWDDGDITTGEDRFRLQLQASL